TGVQTCALPIFTIGREGVGLVLLLGGIVLVCLFAAFRLSGEIRALALALATGVLYGITAAMMKAVAGQIRFGGIAEPFQHWPLYVVCLIGRSEEHTSELQSRENL